MDKPLNGGFICAKHNIGYITKCPTCASFEDKITKGTAETLEYASNLMWDLMNSIIEKQGYSDTTLKLEGAVYDLRGIIQTAEIIE